MDQINDFNTESNIQKEEIIDLKTKSNKQEDYTNDLKRKQEECEQIQKISDYFKYVLKF